MVFPKRTAEQLQIDIEEQRKETKDCLAEKKKLEEELTLFRKRYSTDTDRLESRVRRQNEEANRSRQERLGLNEKISHLKSRLSEVELDEQRCKERTSILERELSDLKGELSDLKGEVNALKAMEKEAVLRQLALSIEFEFKKRSVIPALKATEREKYFFDIYCDVKEVQNLNYFRTMLADSDLQTRVIEDKFQGDQNAYKLFRSTMDALKIFSRGGAHPVTYQGQDITFQVLEKLVNESDMEDQYKHLSKVFARWIYPPNTPMTARVLKAREAFR